MNPVFRGTVFLVYFNAVTTPKANSVVLRIATTNAKSWIALSLAVKLLGHMTKTWTDACSALGFLQNPVIAKLIWAFQLLPCLKPESRGGSPKTFLQWTHSKKISVPFGFVVVIVGSCWKHFACSWWTGYQLCYRFWWMKLDKVLKLDGKNKW